MQHFGTSSEDAPGSPDSSGSSGWSKDSSNAGPATQRVYHTTFGPALAMGGPGYLVIGPACTTVAASAHLFSGPGHAR